ncbi:MAG: hypothetical protein U0169_04550 [Polyangiaceae bacterium]
MSDEGDRISISEAAAGVFWNVDVDLVRGTATLRDHGKVLEERALDVGTLAELRAWATEASVGGDLFVRDQFADGEVDVAITIGGTKVTLRYVTQGPSRYGRAEKLYDFAYRWLHAHRQPSGTS